MDVQHRPRRTAGSKPISGQARSRARTEMIPGHRLRSSSTTVGTGPPVESTMIAVCPSPLRSAVRALDIQRRQVVSGFEAEPVGEEGQLCLECPHHVGGPAEPVALVRKLDEGERHAATP